MAVAYHYPKRCIVHRPSPVRVAAEDAGRVHV